MSKLKVEWVSPEKLRPNPRNPRRNEKAVRAVKASIKEFGFNVPILVDDDNNIIAGHTRYKAARALKLKAVPTIKLRHLSPAELKAFAIADNRTAEIADWDYDELGTALFELEQEDEQLLEAIGWTPSEIHDFIVDSGHIEAKTNQDEVPPLLEEPATSRGDIIRLGRHRLMCGDSTRPDDVDVLLGGKKADMVFTDPPYGVSYDGTCRKGGKSWGKIMNDDEEKACSLLNPFLRNVLRVSRSNLAMYICYGSKGIERLLHALRENQVYYMPLLIWKKDSAPPSWYRYHLNYEVIVFCGEGAKPTGARSKWYGDNSQLAILEVSRGDTGAYGHPTQKPVELVQIALRNSSQADHIVLDPFLGSGSTLIACEKTGRICYGMEIDPRYCDVAVKRWEEYTSSKAKRFKKGRVA